MDDPLYPSFPVPRNPTAFPTDAPASTAQKKAWLGDLHYWIVLMLLDLGYRHELPTSALAKRHMIEPLFALGLDLAATGHGMPFDSLSMGYAGGVDKAGSVEVVRRLALKAGRVAATFEAAATFPPTTSSLNTPNTATAGTLAGI